ncbi:hypothetical protein J4714_14050 [Staphylococcus epidermidis]|nr:hypothetical protein [Staphylococcus epidermidis]
MKRVEKQVSGPHSKSHAPVKPALLQLVAQRQHLPAVCKSTIMASHLERPTKEDMGNRLTQIATRTGDDGTDQVTTPAFLKIAAARAMGDVDELNSHIGLLLCEPLLHRMLRELLIDISTSSSTWAASCPCRYELLKDDALLQLDNAGPLQRRVAAPAGGSSPRRHACGVAGHVCRTVARRAERNVVALGRPRPCEPHASI